jgi:hypothetical protein
MRIQHVHTAIDAVISANKRGEHLTLFLHSPPGTGKSAIVKAAAERHGLPFLDIRLSIHEPVDLTGVPMVKDGKTVFCPPGWLPSYEKGQPDGVLFLDEIAQAMLSMQNVSGQIIYDRCMGDYVLPAGWIVILASNDLKDRAGTTRTPQQINNRCIHIDVEADYQSWRDWALDNDLNPQLVAFLDTRPELLCRPSPDARAFPTPRTWEFASTIIDEELPRAIQFEMLSGTVGPGPAAELVGFLDVYAGLVSWRDVLTNPEHAPLPDGPANNYALMSVLARRVSMDTIDALVTYLRRISREMGNLCMSDIARLHPVLKETRAYTQWSIDNHI